MYSVYRMYCEDIPKSRRGGLTALTETDFLPLYLYTKKMINNHEINKNKMLIGQHF